MKIEQLIAELEGVLSNSGSPDGYLTLREIACEWHDTVLPNRGEIARTREALFALKSQGRLDHCKVRREGLDGRMSTVVAYRVIPE